MAKGGKQGRSSKVGRSPISKEKKKTSKAKTEKPARLMEEAPQAEESSRVDPSTATRRANAGPDTVDMHFVDIAVTVDTGILNAEGSAVGDSEPFTIELRGAAAADFLRALAVKIGKALDAPAPSFVARVDKGEHKFLPKQ